MTELEVFSGALQITNASQRAEYLDRVCGADRVLRQRLDLLLRNHEQAGSFLASPVDERHQAATQTDSPDAETQGVLDVLQPSLKPGSLGRLGHYEVLEVLGQGGFGTVVRAFDEKLQRMVAIKIMSPRLAATSPARKRFIREARSFAAIRNENIVGIHAIEEEPIPFLVMEYVAGETLQQRLDRTGPLDLLDVLRIGLQVAQGLAAAHEMGKIHRDIKPANILLESGADLVKITDFGLARAADDASLTQSGVIAGTPLYMSPEQAQGVAIDHRTDLFSLGSVLYVMCSGRPPFRASTTLAVLKRVAEDAPRPIREIIPETPDWLCDLIGKLHAKQLEARFQTAQEVADTLARCLSEVHRHGNVSEVRGLEPTVRNQASNSECPKPVIPPATRRFVIRKQRWLAAAAILLLLTFVGLGLTEGMGLTRLSGTVLRFFSPDGTLVVEVDDPDVSVAIDGEDIVIKGAGAKEIRIKPGQYKLLASRDGKVVRQEVVTVEKGGHQVVRITREGAAPDETDRRAAEYALSIGATLMILEKNLGQERPLWPGNEVPKEPFDLRVVSLIGNQKVTDAGMDHFKGCKFLTNLDLERTKITAPKILELKRALPDCKIEWDGDIKLLGSSPDRRAAEFVLSIGGLTQIKGGGIYRGADTRSALPQGPFVLRAVDLNHNQKLTDDDLTLFKSCNRLHAVHVAGTKVGDGGLVHLKDSKDLLSLDLGGTQVSNAGLASLKDLLSLTGLTLSATKITDDGLVHFKYCRSLGILRLGDTSVSDTGLAHFKECKSIWWLVLPRTKVTDKGLVTFKDCSDLFHLDLSETDVSDKGLAHFSDCKNLSQLFLGGTKVGNAGLANVKTCTNLAFLELDRTQIGDAGLVHLKDCKNLNHMNLANTQISDATLDQLLVCSKLYTLNVRNTKVSPAGLKKFAVGLPTCRIEWDAGVIEPTAAGDPDRRVAEWLYRQSNLHVFIDNKELSIYPPKELPKAPFQLRRLRIAGAAKVTDETAPIFKGLRHLTHLGIINCRVTDAALVQFKECTHLKELTLHGTGVTDVGVAQLPHFAELQYVNLNQTPVTEAAVKKLAAALPKCKVEWNGGVIEPR